MEPIIATGRVLQTRQPLISKEDRSIAVDNDIVRTLETFAVEIYYDWLNGVGGGI